MSDSNLVFISHSSRDKPLADTIVDALEAQGIDCWVAPRNISFGQDWSEAIVEGIARSKILVLIFSKHANDSIQVRREVQRAFERGVTVIPLRVENILPGPALEYYISSVHWLDAAAGLRPEHLEQLITHARALLTSSTPPARISTSSVSVPPPVPLSTSETAPGIAAVSVTATPVPVQSEHKAPSATPPNNLPHSSTSFVGREHVLQTVMEHLQSAKLVTLSGPGGSGKTRLALEVAARKLSDFPDGAWVIELEALSSEGLLISTVAAELAICEESGRDPIKTLTDALQAKQLLLVLDNVEHLLRPVANLCAAILRRCPHVRLLVTSQERLSITGEQSYRVPSLSLPDEKQIARSADPVSEAQASEAVQLFVTRAMAYRPDFTLTRDNAVAVVSLCRRLDGVPLAIELAAARVRSLSVQDINKRLEDCFRLLTGGSRAALPRQQTIRAAIDWSYDLLTETERVLFNRLAVFAGGWTLEAAEVVCTGDMIEDWEVLDLLAALGDKSLAAYDDRENRQRYNLLNIIRLYALEKLRDSGEESETRERHHEYFRRFAERRPEETSPGVYFDRLESEHENLRLTLDSLLTPNTASEASSLCLLLAEFWWQRGWIQEGSEYLNRMLALAEDIENVGARAGIVGVAGWVAYLQADFTRAGELQQRSLELCQSIGDREQEAQTLNDLALGAQAQGQFEVARDFFARSLAIAHELGDEPQQAARQSNLGLLAVQEGRYDPAREHLDMAYRLFECQQDAQGAAICLCNLTDLALRQNQIEHAETLSMQALQLFQEQNDRMGIAFVLTNLAEVTTRRGDGEQAGHRVKEAVRVCLEVGMRGLFPILLDICARVEALRGHAEAAYFCLAGAEKLRLEMQCPRIVEEQEQVDSLVDGLLSSLEEHVKLPITNRVAALPLEAMIAEVLAL